MLWLVHATRISVDPFGWRSSVQLPRFFVEAADEQEAMAKACLVAHLDKGWIRCVSVAPESELIGR